MASELYLLFLIPIVLVFFVLLVATWRILRNRRAQKQRLSVLRNVSLVVLEDAQEKERAQAREEDGSLVGRLSRMASTRTTTTRSNTIGSSYAHSRSLSHSRKGSAPSDDTTHGNKIPLSDIDEILISRGVLAPNGAPLYYSASRGSAKQARTRSTSVPRKPVPAAALAGSKFQPGQERIELVDEPRELEEGNVDAPQRVRIAESARQGGHAQRNALPRDLSVIGETGASEATNSGFTAAAIALPERAASRQFSADSRDVITPASSYSNPFGSPTPRGSEHGSASPVASRAGGEEEARPVVPASGGGLVRKLSDVVRLRAPKVAGWQRSAGPASPSEAAPPGDRTPNEVFEIVPQSNVQEVVSAQPAAAAATSKGLASKPRRMPSAKSTRSTSGRRASTSNDAVRPARSPSTPPPFRPEDWSRGDMLDSATGAKAPASSLQRAVSLSVPGSGAAGLTGAEGLKRTPSIGVAGSKFKEHIDFDDDDK